MEEFRRKTAAYSKKYFSLREYHAFHLGNVVVIFRENESNTESICVVVNLSTEEEVLKEEITLPGLLKSGQVWRQTDLSLYEGLTTQSEVVKTENLLEYFDILYDGSAKRHILKGTTLPPGFACLVECSKPEEELEAIEAARELVGKPINLPPLGALDYNMILFGTAKEEETRFGQSNYSIPQDKNRQLVYAGFSGIYTLIKEAKRYNKTDLGLFSNLREGKWLLNYYI